MIHFLLDTLNTKSGNNTQDLFHSCKEDILTTLLEQLHVGERNWEPLFAASYNPALQFTSAISKIELPFLDITLRISDARIQNSVYYKKN